MTDVSSWSTTAASNNSASPDGFPEAMAPSGLNDSSREVMAAVARWYSAARTVATLSALQALATPSEAAILGMQGRASAGDGAAGLFRWDASNLSTEVGADEVTSSEGDGGIYIAPATDKTGASGAWVRVFDGPITPAWYGVTGNGSTNDTTGMKAFFDACILNGQDGHIPAGSYVITAGQLAFDNANVDKAFPRITTDGHYAVTFLRADTTDAAMIAITNGTAASASENVWIGGYLGGITYSQNSQTTSSGQHAVTLRGVDGMTFGRIKAVSIGGSALHTPELLFGGTNPDPYNVRGCEFEAIECNFGKRYGIENQNWVGFAGNRIGLLRCVETVLGGWYGFGAGNSIEITEIATCGGWAFDDGTHTAATGGVPSRIRIGICELDDVENGFRLNRTDQFFCESARFVVRHEFSSLNPSGGYWPRDGFLIGGGTSPSANGIFASATFRIESGGVKGDLGDFIDFASVASTNVVIDTFIADNAGLGIDDSDLYSNENTSGSMYVSRDGVPVLDERIKVAALVRSATSVTVPNSGYATSSAKIAFATELYDKGNNYNTTDSEFTVPYDGLYRVDGTICLNVASGTRIRMAFAIDRSSVITIVAQEIRYQDTANDEHTTVSRIVSLEAGDKLFLMADQNTAGAVNLSAPTSTNADLVWSVEALSGASAGR